MTTAGYEPEREIRLPNGEVVDLDTLEQKYQNSFFSDHMQTVVKNLITEVANDDQKVGLDRWTEAFMRFHGTGESYAYSVIAAAAAESRQVSSGSEFVRYLNSDPTYIIEWLYPKERIIPCTKFDPGHALPK